VCLLGVALLMLSQGCAGRRVSKVGQVSERPLIHVQVGTTVDIYIPAIEFAVDEKGDAATTIP